MAMSVLVSHFKNLPRVTYCDNACKIVIVWCTWDNELTRIARNRFHYRSIGAILRAHASYSTNPFRRSRPLILDAPNLHRILEISFHSLPRFGHFRCFRLNIWKQAPETSMKYYQRQTCDEQWVVGSDGWYVTMKSPRLWLKAISEEYIRPYERFTSLQELEVLYDILMTPQELSEAYSIISKHELVPMQYVNFWCRHSHGRESVREFLDDLAFVSAGIACMKRRWKHFAKTMTSVVWLQVLLARREKQEKIWTKVISSCISVLVRFRVWVMSSSFCFIF